MRGQTAPVDCTGAFNAFNTPSFSVSGIMTAIGSGTAGTITSTNVDNREFQLALKLVF